MRRPTACLDASFVVRLLTDPTAARVKAAWATAIGDGRRFVAPALIQPELCNAFYRLERAGLFPVATIDAFVAEAFSLPIELAVDSTLSTNALGLARRLGLTASYDAHYLALAEREACELWSVDARLARIASDLGVVRLMSD